MSVGTILDSIFLQLGVENTLGLRRKVLEIAGKGVTELSLVKAKLEFRDLLLLSELAGIVKLDLSLTGAQNHWLKPLCNNSSLEELYLVGNRISDVTFILGHEKLRILDLENNPLEPSSIVALFEWKKARKSAGIPIEIRVSNCSLDEKNIEAIRQASRAR